MVPEQDCDQVRPWEREREGPETEHAVSVAARAQPAADRTRRGVGRLRQLFPTPPTPLNGLNQATLRALEGRRQVL